LVKNQLVKGKSIFVLIESIYVKSKSIFVLVENILAVDATSKEAALNLFQGSLF
jgi:hypothetical protein